MIPEAVADRLHSAAIHLLRAVRRADAESGLSAARLSALSVVVFGGPISLGALAAAEQVRPPTMSLLVRRLEADGLVERLADPADRRGVLLRATPRGAALLQAGRARRLALLSARLRGLPPADLATLDAAARLMEALARDPPPDPPAP